jgi:hypothetical protein
MNSEMRHVLRCVPFPADCAERNRLHGRDRAEGIVVRMRIQRRAAASFPGKERESARSAIAPYQSLGSKAALVYYRCEPQATMTAEEVEV